MRGRAGPTTRPADRLRAPGLSEQPAHARLGPPRTPAWGQPRPQGPAFATHTPGAGRRWSPGRDAPAPASLLAPRAFSVPEPCLAPWATSLHLQSPHLAQVSPGRPLSCTLGKLCSLVLHAWAAGLHGVGAAWGRGTWPGPGGAGTAQDSLGRQEAALQARGLSGPWETSSAPQSSPARSPPAGAPGTEGQAQRRLCGPALLGVSLHSGGGTAGQGQDWPLQRQGSQSPA